MTRGKVLKRAPADHSQRLRRGIQLLFLALNIWIGVAFFLWVRFVETGGRSLRVARPPAVEGWLPIASLMNLKVFLLDGVLPRVHPAGMFLLVAFVAASLLFRKAFCGWLCPVGTISEYLWRLGRTTFGRNFRLPRKLDVALRALKYLLLGFFLYAIAMMPAAAIRTFLEGPFGIIDDVKMLNFFRYLGLAGAIVIAILVVASVFVQNFWCRYVCPYGALMGLFSLASPLRIRRKPDLCIDCAKCRKACPSALPVDRLITIRSAECLGCMQCVAACPADQALFLSAPRSKRVPAWVVAAGLAGLLVGIYAAARITGHWRTNLSDTVYFQLVPRAAEFDHGW
jgi:polyferredoxin